MTDLHPDRAIHLIGIDILLARLGDDLDGAQQTVDRVGAEDALAGILAVALRGWLLLADNDPAAARTLLLDYAAWLQLDEQALP